MNISKEEAASRFANWTGCKRPFSRSFQQEDASPYEFDVVINCEYIKEPRSAAEIILTALGRSFGLRNGRR